jgi:phage/plasmid-like protein (TIGR03299 family)
LAQHSFKDRKVIYRNDTNEALSVVSNKYNIVQPKEVIEFFRDLTEKSGFQMETAGALFGGKKLWALAKTGESAFIGGVDEIKPYLLVATSLDGSMSTCAHLTSVRVVCNNTLRQSIGAAGQKAAIRIPHMAKFEADQVKIDLGIVQENWEQFIEQAETLAKFELNRDTAIKVVAEQLKIDKDLSPEEMIGNSRVLKTIIELFEGNAIGMHLSTVQGSAWGLANAVTEYFDHHTVSATKDNSRAFERANLTDRASLKSNVFNELIQMAA